MRTTKTTQELCKHDILKIKLRTKIQCILIYLLVLFIVYYIICNCVTILSLLKYSCMKYSWWGVDPTFSFIFVFVVIYILPYSVDLCSHTKGCTVKSIICYFFSYNLYLQGLMSHWHLPHISFIVSYIGGSDFFNQVKIGLEPPFL
jgi:hypothetical protein